MHIKHIQYAICALSFVLFRHTQKQELCKYLMKFHSKQKLSNYSKVKAINQVGDPKLYFSPLKQAKKKLEPYTCINTCIYNCTLIQQGELEEERESSASWHCSISSVEYRIEGLGHKTVDPTFQLGAIILVHFSNVECSHSLLPITRKNCGGKASAWP